VRQSALNYNRLPHPIYIVKGFNFMLGFAMTFLFVVSLEILTKRH